MLYIRSIYLAFFLSFSWYSFPFISQLYPFWIIIFLDAFHIYSKELGFDLCALIIQIFLTELKSFKFIIIWLLCLLSILPYHVFIMCWYKVVTHCWSLFFFFSAKRKGYSFIQKHLNVVYSLIYSLWHCHELSAAPNH